MPVLSALRYVLVLALHSMANRPWTSLPRRLAFPWGRLRKRYMCYRRGVLHWIAVNKVEAKVQKFLLIQGLVEVRGRHRAPTLVKVTA